VRSFSFAVERTGLRAMAGGRAAKRGQ